MIIIQDTREQRPFHFSSNVQVIRKALPVGDYSIPGFEHDITVERKSLSDLLGSITHDRERFERELRQFRGFRLAVLMIETDWPTLLLGLFAGRQVNPDSVIGSLMAFAMRYRVVPVLCSDHATGAILTERILELFARRLERDYKVLQTSEIKAVMEGAGHVE